MTWPALFPWGRTRAHARVVDRLCRRPILPYAILLRWIVLWLRSVPNIPSRTMPGDQDQADRRRAEHRPEKLARADHGNRRG